MDLIEPDGRRIWIDWMSRCTHLSSRCSAHKKRLCPMCDYIHHIKYAVLSRIYLCLGSVDCHHRCRLLLLCEVWLPAMPSTDERKRIISRRIILRIKNCAHRRQNAYKASIHTYEKNYKFHYIIYEEIIDAIICTIIASSMFCIDPHIWGSVLNTILMHGFNGNSVKEDT